MLLPRIWDEGFDAVSVRSGLVRELGWGGLSDRTLSC